MCKLSSKRAITPARSILQETFTHPLSEIPYAYNEHVKLFQLAHFYSPHTPPSVLTKLTPSLSLPQISEVRGRAHERDAAVRGRAQEAVGAAEESLRGHQDLPQGATGRR